MQIVVHYTLLFQLRVWTNLICFGRNCYLLNLLSSWDGSMKNHWNQMNAMLSDQNPHDHGHLAGWVIPVPESHPHPAKDPWQIMPVSSAWIWQLTSAAVSQWRTQRPYPMSSAALLSGRNQNQNPRKKIKGPVGPCAAFSPGRLGTGVMDCLSGEGGIDEAGAFEAVETNSPQRRDTSIFTSVLHGHRLPA